MPDSDSSDGGGNDGNNKDFVIDEGFPVLNNFHRRLRRRKRRREKADAIAADNGKPLAASTDDDDDDADPLPRSPFASYADALSLSPSSSSPTGDAAFLTDCDTVFTARTREDDESYSSGATFFLPAMMKPRCALEDLAMKIFRAHVAGLDGGGDEGGGDSKAAGKKEKGPNRYYDPERSGAEWWTLVLDAAGPSSGDDGNADKKEDDDSEDEEEDEVGLHFDADYALEDQARNFLVHPRIATVTYLANPGAPTLVMDRRPPPPADASKQGLGGDIRTAWLSHPHAGKHIAFDGRLLHGAPAMYFPAADGVGVGEEKGKVEDDGGGKEPSAKRAKVETENGTASVMTAPAGALKGKRITFMVNIWLNHCPVDAEILDDDLLNKLTTVWEGDGKDDNDSNKKDDAATTTKSAKLKRDESYEPPFSWNLRDAQRPDDLRTISLSCVGTDGSHGDGAAGLEEVVLCRRKVVVTFGASADDLRDASRRTAAAADGGGGSSRLELGEGALVLEVGTEDVSSDEEEEEDDEEE